MRLASEVSEEDAALCVIRGLNADSRAVLDQRLERKYPDRDPHLTRDQLLRTLQYQDVKAELLKESLTAGVEVA